MRKAKQSFISKEIQSFRAAFMGFKELLQEKHFKVHLIVSIIVLIIGLYTHLSSDEWLWIILSIFLVFITEGFNTVIEKIADYIQPEKDEKIRIIKDISAAVVLMAAIFSILTAVIIFGNKLID